MNVTLKYYDNNLCYVVNITKKNKLKKLIINLLIYKINKAINLSQRIAWFILLQ